MRKEEGREKGGRVRKGESEERGRKREGEG